MVERIGKYMSPEAKLKCIQELSPVAGCVLNMKQGKYLAKYLEPLETLSVGQTCDLKIDTGNSRIWLSRCSTLDGMPFDNMVTVEGLKAGKWVILDTYAGGPV